MASSRTPSNSSNLSLESDHEPTSRSAVTIAAINSWVIGTLLAVFVILGYFRVRVLLVVIYWLSLPRAALASSDEFSQPEKGLEKTEEGSRSVGVWVVMLILLGLAITRRAGTFGVALVPLLIGAIADFAVLAFTLCIAYVQVTYKNSAEAPQFPNNLSQLKVPGRVLSNASPQPVRIDVWIITALVILWDLILLKLFFAIWDLLQDGVF